MITHEIIQLINQNKIEKFYKTKDWKHIRKQALERDHNECQLCKQKGRYTNADTVHHVKELKQYPMLAMSLSNLISLCPDCHDAEHKRFQYGEVEPKFMNEERW